MFSIMLVDDQPAILQYLSNLVEATGIAQVVAAETNGPAAMESAERHSPDLIMLDVSLPDMPGIEIARGLIKSAWDTRILAVSAYANPIYVRSMLDAGAKGYMLKDNAANEIKSAIESVMEGSNWIGDGLAVPEFR